jgi:hypothetical protein
MCVSKCTVKLLTVFLSSVVILCVRLGWVEVRVAEFCSTAYEERVMELHCWCGSA